MLGSSVSAISLIIRHWFSSQKNPDIATREAAISKSMKHAARAPNHKISSSSAPVPRLNPFLSAASPPVQQ